MKYNYDKTIERFSGIASNYRCYRPQIPCELFRFLNKLIGKKPNLVVDLGSGTGESTIPWSRYAKNVIGIEPSPDMIKKANDDKPDNVKYLVGFGHDTGLKDGCADVVTCFSSLHWMEPKTTITEIARILRKGGVFCACGYFYPFFNESWQLTKSFEEWRIKCSYDQKKNDDQYAKQYNINESFDLFREMNIFSYLRTTYLHSKLFWSFDEFNGYVNLYKDLINTDKSEMYSIAQKAFGNRKLTVIITYTIRLGII